MLYFTAESRVFFDIIYNQPRKLFCPFFGNFLVYTTTGMGHWLLYALKWTISYTRSKAISVLSVTKLFNTLFKIDLAIYFASDVVENSVFAVYSSILYLSIGRVTPFLNNDHLNTLVKDLTGKVNILYKCLSDLVTVTNVAPSPENAYPYTKICLHTAFLSAYQYPSIQFQLRKLFFNCVFTQIYAAYLFLC